MIDIIAIPLSRNLFTLVLQFSINIIKLDSYLHKKEQIETIYFLYKFSICFQVTLI